MAATKSPGGGYIVASASHQTGVVALTFSPKHSLYLLAACPRTASETVASLFTGVCDDSAQCVEKNSDAPVLDDLLDTDAALSWAQEETLGLKNYIWLIIVAILIIFLCSGGGCAKSKRKERSRERQAHYNSRAVSLMPR